jgi:hypothetical protein
MQLCWMNSTEHQLFESVSMHSCLSVLVCVCMVCKSLRMHFTPTSVGHTQSVRPSTPPSWKAVTNWHDHPLSSSSSFLMVGVDKYIIISPKSGQTIIQTVCWVCPISGLNRKNPVIILASTQKYSESKTSIVSSFKLYITSLWGWAYFGECWITYAKLLSVVLFHRINEQCKPS